MTQTSGTRDSVQKRRAWRYGPLILWMLWITLASGQEFSAFNTSKIIRPLLLWLLPNLSESCLALLHFLIRKAAHFSEYAILGLLASRAFYSSAQKFLRRFWFQTALGLIVVYALLDEYHQRFVPSRTASIYDSGIDLAGGLIAVIFFALWVRLRPGLFRANGAE